MIEEAGINDQSSLFHSLTKISKSKVDLFDSKGQTFVGTPNFMAPELIRRAGKSREKLIYGKAVDWYIYGIIENE